MRFAPVIAAALLALVTPVASADSTVDANGNALTGGLSFTPPFTKAAVGDEVSWHNTDFVAPHTATEQHDLWSVAGDFGPPLTPGGFAPGATASRLMEAGTHDYLCLIHGSVMSGRISVPVTVRRSHGDVVGVWSPDRPSEGNVFDVQIDEGRGWRSAFRGTRRSRGLLVKRSSLKGVRSLEVRARLRDAGEKKKSTGWSPVARVKP